MNEKIGIRLISQFLVMCMIRFIMLGGKYAQMNLSITLSLIVYAIILTILFECFDRLMIGYMKYYRLLILVLIIGWGCLCVFGNSLYLKVLFGYIGLVMIKSLWQLSSLQLPLEEYQRDYMKNHESML